MLNVVARRYWKYAVRERRARVGGVGELIDVIGFVFVCGIGLFLVFFVLGCFLLMFLMLGLVLVLASRTIGDGGRFAARARAFSGVLGCFVV